LFDIFLNLSQSSSSFFPVLNPVIPNGPNLGLCPILLLLFECERKIEAKKSTENGYFLFSFFLSFFLCSVSMNLFCFWHISSVTTKISFNFVINFHKTHGITFFEKRWFVVVVIVVGKWSYYFRVGFVQINLLFF